MSIPIRLSMFELLRIMGPSHVDAGQSADAADLAESLDNDMVDYDNCEWVAPPRGYMGDEG